MENLQYVVCVACYLELGIGKRQEEDVVLRCAACKLWQHWKCAKGVSPSFYAQFYLSVTLGETPTQWLCHYCSMTKQEIPPASPAMPPKKNPALRIPSNSPPSANDDSEDELHMTFDIARTGREGLALDTESQESGQEEEEEATSCQVVITPRSIFLDSRPLPVTYSLVKEPSGRKVIMDCHGNIFFTTGHIKDQAESYLCAEEGCRFMVQVSETIGEFLLDGSTDFHNHRSPGSESEGSDADTADADTADADTADTADSDDSLPSLAATPFNTPAKPRESTRQQPRPQAWYHSISPVLPTLPAKVIATPHQTPAIHTKTIETPLTLPESNDVRPSEGSEASFCSNTTDDNNTAHLETPAIHRFQPLTTPAINKSGANFSFSSSDSSSDDLNITDLCDRLGDDNSPTHDDKITTETDAPATTSHSNHCDQGGDNTAQNDDKAEKTTGDLDAQPPSPTDTIPYCDSSDSEDEATPSTQQRQQPDINYTVQDGTASGARSRLTDSLGYTYQIKFKLGARIFWICTERGIRCPGTVIQQRRNHFARGTAFHNHQPGHLQPCLDTSSTSQTPASKSETSPASKTSASQSETTIPASQTHVSQSQTTSPASRHHPTSSPSTMIPASTDDGMMLKKPSTTRHQSKVARIVKSTASTAVTSEPPALETPSQSSSSSSKEGEESGEEGDAPEPVCLQEIATCGQPRFTAKSALIDHDGFLYKKKMEDVVKYQTVWKCTNRGPQGTCRGKVTLNYISNFNRDDSQYFCWTMNHSDSVDNVTFTFKPHNHESDWDAALMFKLKTLVHMLVFYDGHYGVNATYLVQDAWKRLEPEERAALPDYENDKSLKHYVTKVMKEYKMTEAKKGLHRYDRYRR